MNLRTYGPIFVSAAIAITGVLWYDSGAPHRALTGEDVAALSAAVEERYEALTQSTRDYRAYTNATYWPSNTLISVTNLDLTANDLQRLIMSSAVKFYYDPAGTMHSIGQVIDSAETIANYPQTLILDSLMGYTSIFYVDPSQSDIPTNLCFFAGGYNLVGRDPMDYRVYRVEITNALPTLRGWSGPRQIYKDGALCYSCDHYYGGQTVWMWNQFFRPDYIDYLIPGTNLAEQARNCIRRMTRTAEIVHVDALSPIITGWKNSGSIYTNILNSWKGPIYEATTSACVTVADSSYDLEARTEYVMERTRRPDLPDRISARSLATWKDVQIKLDYPPERAYRLGMINRLRVYVTYIHRASVKMSLDDERYNTAGIMDTTEDMRALLSDFGVPLGDDFELADNYSPKFALGWKYNDTAHPAQKNLLLVPLLDLLNPMDPPTVRLSYGARVPKFCNYSIITGDRESIQYSETDARAAVVPYILVTVVDWNFRHLADNETNRYRPTPYSPGWTNTTITVTTNGVPNYD